MLTTVSKMEDIKENAFTVFSKSTSHISFHLNLVQREFLIFVCKNDMVEI